MKREYFVRHADLLKVMDIAPWSRCRRARRGSGGKDSLYIVLLTNEDAAKCGDMVWLATGLKNV